MSIFTKLARLWLAWGNAMFERREVAILSVLVAAGIGGVIGAVIVAI